MKITTRNQRYLQETIHYYYSGYLVYEYTPSVRYIIDEIIKHRGYDTLLSPVEIEVMRGTRRPMIKGYNVYHQNIIKSEMAKIFHNNQK